MSRLFNPDGFLWRALDVLTDIFALSVLWLLCCIPVITIGAATTALYDSVVRCVRYRESGTYKRFFNTFKSDFGTSALSTVVWVIIIGSGLIVSASLKANRDTSSAAAVLSVAYSLFLALPIGTACWLFPLLSRFSYRFKDLNLTALKLALGYLPRTIIIVLIVDVLLELCLRYVFPFFFLPACMMLLWSLFIEPVFEKFGGGLKKQTDQIENSGE